MTYQTKITGQKKHNLKKKPDSPGFNQSFFTVPNTLWYYYAVNWLPHKKKPLVCLPCASGKKTRAKYGKKMFSHSTTHQFLSAITRCEDTFQHFFTKKEIYDIFSHYALIIPSKSQRGLCFSTKRL